MSISSLTRWDPFRDLIALEDRMNRLLGGPASPLTASDALGSWVPPVDIFEDNDRVVLRAEIPGVGKEDIDIKVENGTITLRGEKKQEKEIGEGSAYRVERFYGSFSRSFVLPTSIDAAAIKATYRDGILELILPKAETSKPRKISIQGS